MHRTYTALSAACVTVFHTAILQTIPYGDSNRIKILLNSQVTRVSKMDSVSIFSALVDIFTLHILFLSLSGLLPVVLRQC